MPKLKVANIIVYYVNVNKCYCMFVWLFLVRLFKIRQGATDTN